MEPRGKTGEGAFRWNRGGWFGAQVGGTLWLVLLGGLMLFQARPVGGVVLLFGLIPNLFGLVLWLRRRSLSPYAAIQGLLAVSGLCALVALLCIQSTGVPASSLDLPSLWFLLMYPGLMLVFHFQQRGARKAAD